MIIRLFKHWTVVIILVLLSQNAWTQDIGSGLDFLNISPSTNLLGIAEAQTATLAGPASIYSNPALLAFENRSGLDLAYTLWIANVRNQFAAINMPRNRSSLAFSVYNSRSDEFFARDQPGPPAGTLSISYLSLASGWAYRVGPISAGVTLQYLREEIFQFRANGYSLSFGTAASFSQDRIRIGAAVLNLGEMQALDEIATLLPSAFRMGLNADIIEISTPGYNDLPILISLHADYQQPIEDSPSSDFIETNRREAFYNLGLSAELAELFTLRSGYKFGPTERPFSLGAEISLDPINIHYAMIPFSTGFGTVHSIGLQYYF